MRGLAFWFILSAVGYLVLGVVFGIYMAASQDHTLSPAHGHLNLVGWVSMAIFGLFYHLVPGAAATRLAKLHFAVMTAGLWLLVPGIVLAIRGTTETLAALGSVVTLASLLLFLAILARSRVRTRHPAPSLASAVDRTDVRALDSGLATKM